MMNLTWKEIMESEDFCLMSYETGEVFDNLEHGACRWCGFRCVSVGCRFRLGADWRSGVVTHHFFITRTARLRPRRAVFGLNFYYNIFLSKCQ